MPSRELLFCSFQLMAAGNTGLAEPVPLGSCGTPHPSKLILKHGKPGFCLLQLSCQDLALTGRSWGHEPRWRSWGHGPRWRPLGAR